MTTDTEAPGELEVPHLKARLWHELAELHREQLRSPSSAPGGGAVPLTGRRRRWSRPALAAAAALTAALVVAAQLTGTSSDTPLMGRIVAATDEAAATSVVHWVSEQTRPGEAGPPSVTEYWIDETSDATRMLVRDGQGDPGTDVGPLTGPTIDSPAHSGQRVVDYCAQEYTDHVDTGGASIDIDRAGGVRSLADQVADGHLVEDGTEVVDGRELIRLVRVNEAPGDTQILLVDTDSYLPVRARGTLSTGESYSHTYEYLPRTPENLALIVPPVPEGFTPMDPLTGDFPLVPCGFS